MAKVPVKIVLTIEIDYVSERKYSHNARAIVAMAVDYINNLHPIALQLSTLLGFWDDIYLCPYQVLFRREKFEATSSLPRNVDIFYKAAETNGTFPTPPY